MSKAVFLIHGYATDKNDFNPIIPFLEERYDEVRRAELPGHDKKRLKGFTSDKTIEYVDENVKDLIEKYDQVDIIGFSMGGALASYIGANYPVHKVVMLAPANVYLNLSYPVQKTKKWLEYMQSRINNEDDFDKECTQSEFNYILRDDKAALKVTQEYILPNYNLRTIAEFIKVINFCKTHIKENETPTFIIMGDIDQLVPQESEKFLSKYCKNMKSKTMKNISHMMLRSTKADKIITLVLKFLDAK